MIIQKLSMPEKIAKVLKNCSNSLDCELSDIQLKYILDEFCYMLENEPEFNEAQFRDIINGAI